MPNLENVYLTLIQEKGVYIEAKICLFGVREAISRFSNKYNRFVA
jgi:hypothetical protein